MLERRIPVERGLGRSRVLAAAVALLLAGLAATHPARLELSEFHDRWQQVLSRSRARAAKLQQRAGEGRG